MRFIATATMHAGHRLHGKLAQNQASTPGSMLACGKGRFSLVPVGSLDVAAGTTHLVCASTTGGEGWTTHKEG